MKYLIKAAICVSKREQRGFEPELPRLRVRAFYHCATVLHFQTFILNHCVYEPGTLNSCSDFVLLRIGNTSFCSVLNMSECCLPLHNSARMTYLKYLSIYKVAASLLFVCLSVFCQTAGPIVTKFGTHM